jgi:hypothetical protein
MTCDGKHHEGCGCPACAGVMQHKKKLFMAMVLFGMMAICNAMVAGIIHIILHAIEIKKE